MLRNVKGKKKKKKRKKKKKQLLLLIPQPFFSVYSLSLSLSLDPRSASNPFFFYYSVIEILIVDPAFCSRIHILLFFSSINLTNPIAQTIVHFLDLRSL